MGSDTLTIAVLKPVEGEEEEWGEGQGEGVLKVRGEDQVMTVKLAEEEGDRIVPHFLSLSSRQ